MNNAAAAGNRLIVILNDNDMSIAPPVGSLRNSLARLVSLGQISRLRANSRRSSPGRCPSRCTARCGGWRNMPAAWVTGGTLFDELGFYYVGPVDGHDVRALVEVLENVRDAEVGPMLVHVVTKKGKGYAPAENAADKYHGVVKFDVVSGVQAKPAPGAPSYTGVYAQSAVAPRWRATRRSSRLPPRCLRAPASTRSPSNSRTASFDVGIAEQHAVTFAAGLAAQGYRPFATIYSTFLQRAYDQVVHDVAIQNLPVRFAMDRAGLVGADGATHAGSFDLAYLCTCRISW